MNLGTKFRREKVLKRIERVLTILRIGNSFILLFLVTRVFLTNQRFAEFVEIWDSKERIVLRRNKRKFRCENVEIEARLY